MISKVYNHSIKQGTSHLKNSNTLEVSKMKNDSIVVHTEEEYNAIIDEYIKKGYEPFECDYQQTALTKGTDRIYLTLIDEII